MNAFPALLAAETPLVTRTETPAPWWSSRTATRPAGFVAARRPLRASPPASSTPSRGRHPGSGGDEMMAPIIARMVMINPVTLAILVLLIFAFIVWRRS